MSTLRDTLHALPPEPPAELGLAGNARRRAGRIRRRRALAGSAVTAVVAALAVAAVALPRPADVVPAATSPLVGTFPEWPRRGDGDAALDADAVATWTAFVEGPAKARLVGTPRVLYSGAADRLVVLAGTTDPGGDRLAVDGPGAGGDLAVLADRAAPLPGTVALRFLIAAPPEPTNGYYCGAPLVDDPAYATRLLVVAAPGVREARWLRTGPLGLHCPFSTAAAAPREHHPVEVRDGVALADIPMGSGEFVFGEVRVSGGRWVDAVRLQTPATAPYPAPDAAPASATLPRFVRTDHSRADALALLLDDDGIEGVAGGERCREAWSRSLPDGTAAVFCIVRSPDENDPTRDRAVVVADGADRRFRVYDFPPTTADVFATVVTGRTARWLVVVGPKDLAGATLLGDREVPVPLVDGAGFLRLEDGQATGDTFLRTSSGGTYPVVRIDGREVVPD